MAFTQVTGQVLDPSGFPYAGANLSARLVSTSTPRVGAQLIDAYANVKLDAAGQFSMQLVDNATVTPVASTWTFQVDTDNSNVPPPLGTGPQSFTVAGITITGAAQSVSAALQAAAPLLTRTISSGSGGFAGGIIGPSAGHSSVLQPGGNAVLEILSNALGVSPLLVGNSAVPDACIGFVIDGAGDFLYIFGTSDGTNFAYIELGTVGGTPAIHIDPGSGGKIGFFNAVPAARQSLAGGFGGNAAIQSLVGALGTTGLILGGTATNGQNIGVDGAITKDVGCVVISKAGILAGTLAAPTAGTQDYLVLRIVSLTANAHVIVTSAAGFNAGGAGADTLTFTTAAIGDSVTLMAFNGVWYIIASRGTITLS